MNVTLTPSNFLLLRKPLLSLSIFHEWRNHEQPDEFILHCFSQPLLDEALYLSSPSLHARLREFKKGEGLAINQSHEYKKFMSSLSKYLSRAAYRCTPFGLFSQIQLGEFSSTRKQTSTSEREIVRGINLDSEVEGKLWEKILSNFVAREQIKWQVSSTAFIHGSHLSYVDWLYRKSGERCYRSVELQLTEPLVLIQTHCQEPVAFSQICQLLTDSDVSLVEAVEFVHELIACRFLVPDLAPTNSNSCTLSQGLAKCSEHPIFAPLYQIQQLLIRLRERCDSGESLVSDYRSLHDQIKHYLDEPHLSNNAVQVDSYLQSRAQIDADNARRLTSVVQLLANHCVEKQPALARYKAEFFERFEDREVCLAYAMHSEVGLPFPRQRQLHSTLLEGIQNESQDWPTNRRVEQISPLDLHLLQILIGEGGSSRDVIQLNRDDFPRLGEEMINKVVPSEGLFAHVSVHATAGDAAPILELRTIGGVSGIELISRFTYLNHDLNNTVREYFEQHTHENEDCVYAEITHHPQDRILNVTRRPRLYPFDLVYAGKSDLPRDHQFWLEDLSIQLVMGRFVLREKKTGKRVIPRLNSAHNYNFQQLGVYQFLANLQEDDDARIGFRWPSIVFSMKYLPRVEIEGIVVAKARWRLNKEDVSALIRAVADDTVEAWRNTHRLPRFISLDQGDNHLPIDLKHPPSIDLLIDEIINESSVYLYENISLELAAANSAWNASTSEWVMPLEVKREITLDGLSQQSTVSSIRDAGSFTEGKICPSFEEWVYLRVYSGAGYIDRLLHEHVGPVLRDAQKKRKIDRWFFVRYRDNFEHVRIRFHSLDQHHLIETMMQLNEQLQNARNKGLLWRIQTDDYVLEETRYGGHHALELCEQLFALDSEDVLLLLDLEKDHLGVHDRWLYSLYSIDQYATLLCPKTKERSLLLTSLAQNFLHEHSDIKSRSKNKIILGERFRALRSQLDFLRNKTTAMLTWEKHLQEQATKRIAILQRLRTTISEHSTYKQLEVMQSLMHMHCNRLIQGDSRLHEMVWYDFAVRLERARNAIARSSMGS